MSILPEHIRLAFADREGPAIFATVDPAGAPNAVYVGAMSLCGEDAVAIADNYFHKTRANLLAGSRASLLFLTKERKSYQLKGRVEYLSTGPIFEGMKSWNPPRHPGVATALLRVEEIYSGAQRLV